MNNNIGIVVVSHCAEVAKSVALMSSQMSGGSFKVSHCGGSSDGRLGSNVKEVIRAIDEAWSDKGVAIFVDLGSSEANSKLAIASFDKIKTKKIIIMNTPLVEGVITTSSLARDGESLQKIRHILKNMGL